MKCYVAVLRVIDNDFPVTSVVNVSGVRYLQLAIRMARYIWQSRSPQNLIDFSRPWDLSDGVFSRLFLHCLNIDGCANRD